MKRNTSREKKKLFLKREKYVSACVHSVMSDSLQPHGLCSLLRFFVHGILQVRILEWVAIFFSRGPPKKKLFLKRGKHRIHNYKIRCL